MDEKKNKHVTIIESSDNNVNNNNNGSRTSMDILADLATALVDKEMESLLPNSLVKLLDDTKLTTASDYYERAIKTMKQKSESTNDSSSSSSSSLDRKAIALSSVVFTVGRPFSPNGFLLSQLADHARVSLEALLYPLLSYIELLDMTKEYEETVKATNDRFVMCSLLHERYTRIICRTEDISKESTLGPSLQNDKKGLYRVLMIRLGWLLFVLLKDSDMFSEDELRDKLYHILLCCVNFVSMNSPLGMFATESENNNGGVKSYYSFEALCAQDSMPYAETLDVQDTVFRTFVKRLCGDGLLAVKSLGNTRSAAQRDFIPLEVLRTALTNLDNTYSEKLSFSGEFDERYFQRDLSMFSAAQQQPQPMSSAVATTPIRSSVASNSPTHPLFTGDLRARHAPLPTPVAKSTPSRMGATSSSLFLSGTPAPPPPPTPVRTKVSMLKWLDGLMRVQPGPGPVLSRLLRDNGAEEQAAALNAKVEELTVGLGLPGIQRTVLRQKQQQQQQQRHIPPLPPALPFPISFGPVQFSSTINNNQSNNNNQNNIINNNNSNETSSSSNSNNDNDNNFIVHDPSKRVELCMRLFYMLLDSLIAREIHTKRMNLQSSASKSRLSGATGSGDAREMLDAVFSTESLVRAVLAVAAEIVAYAARNTALAFPAVIRALKLQPSEFFRILINIFSLNDLFQFPYEASAHLRSIEAVLVDTFVWESTSSSLPIYADTPSTEIISIAEAVTAAPALRGSVPAEARSVPSTPERNHSSVVSVSLPPKTVASTEITTDVPLTISTTTVTEKNTINNNNGNNEHKKDAVMHRGFAILLRRLFILSAEKFEVLCKDYPQELVNQMWYVFVHTIAEHKDLLPGHTGTQLVLCAYAGVMRSNGRTADLHAAAATLLHGSSPPSAVCAGIPISSLSIQASSEKKTGTLHDYYNTIYARSVSSVLHKAKFLFRAKPSAEGEGGGCGGKGEEKQQKRVQPAILLQSCRKPLGVRSTRSGSAMLSPRRLMFKQNATPSSSSSSSSLSTVFPQSPYRSLSLFTEVKVRPNKRPLSGTTLFPQRTLNFDDIGGGNEYADDEKSESSDPEKERGGNGKKKKKKNGDDDDEEEKGGGIDTKKPRYTLNELDF